MMMNEKNQEIDGVIKRTDGKCHGTSAQGDKI